MTNRYVASVFTPASICSYRKADLSRLISTLLKRDPCRHCMLASRKSLTTMRIAQVEINNFRGIQKATIHLPKHGVLFGPNNIGKTSIAEALAIALGREPMAPMLSDWDFFGGRPKPDSRILIIVTITAFADDAMPDDFPLWFRGETAAQPVWWSEKTRTLTAAPTVRQSTSWQHR